MNVLGLISGSSLDGLDMALCEFTGQERNNLKWHVISTNTVPFDYQLAEKLKRAPKVSARELLEIEVLFSKFCIDQVNKLKKESAIEIDFVASHGHTVFHYPEDGYTLQIGKGSLLSELTGIPSITDFRSNDIARGGQGAPVAPIVEQWLYAGYKYYLNLGGIANVSCHSGTRILSFDSCPCNQVLNYISNILGFPYDDKGLIAEKGEVHQPLMEEWKQLDYFSQPIPKSMDNTWVQEKFIPILNRHRISPEDQMASMVEFIADQLSSDIRLMNEDGQKQREKILITGGGALNNHLINILQKHLTEESIEIKLPDQQTINFKEAILIALMGYLRVLKLPNTIPSVTGASGPTSGGAIYYPI